MKLIPYTEDSNPEQDDFYPVGEHVGYWIKFIDLITIKLLEIIGDKRVNIWCSGSSGAILAALLAKSVKNTVLICHVKKEGEDSHHGNIFNKYHKDGFNVILDDFMRSGETINRIYRNMILATPHVIVIANCMQLMSQWPLKFRPDYLIIDRRSIDGNPEIFHL